MELIKSRRQIESQLVSSWKTSSSQIRMNRSPTTSLRSLISERSLFKGLWATIARDAPVGHPVLMSCPVLIETSDRSLLLNPRSDHRQAFGVYFSSYQYMLDRLEGQTVSVLLNHLLAGGVAGSASWVIVVSVTKL